MNDHPNHVYTISTLEILLEVAQGTYSPRTFCGGSQNVPRDWEWLNNRQIIDLLHSGLGPRHLVKNHE